MDRKELKKLIEQLSNELYGIKDCDSISVHVAELNNLDLLLREICSGHTIDRQISSNHCPMSREHRDKIAHSKKGQLLSEETKERMRQNNSRRCNVYQFTMQNELVGVWNSTRDIERKLGFNSSLISKVCRGIKGKKTAYGYIWKYRPIGNEQQITIKIEKTYK